MCLVQQEYSVDFKRLIESLVQRFCPIQIYCFAKSTTSYTIRTCFGEAIDSSKQDYFLLLVTEGSARIEHTIQDFINAHFKLGVVTVLAHGKRAILEALKARNRFFTNIYRNGTMLYSSEVLIPENANVTNSVTSSFLIDASYLDHRLLIIEGFLSGAKECLSNLQLNTCLFMLHQVTEQCCLTLIRIHLGYQSDIHNLRRLLQLCCCFSIEPIQVFLAGTKEDERLFNILVRSYSETRYSDGFLADKKDVHLLFHRVELFLELTKSICNKDNAVA